MNYLSELSGPATFLEQITDAFFELDRFFHFKYLNKAAEGISGRSKVELIGQNIWEVFPNAIGSLSYVNFHKAISRQEELVFEECFPSLKANYLIKLYPTPEGGIWVYFCKIDKMESKQEHVGGVAQNFKSFFENMTPGVIYQDSNSEIICANPAAEEILGLSNDEMLGRTSADDRWKTMHLDGDEIQAEQHPSVVALRTGKSVTDFKMKVFNPKTNEHRCLLVDSVPQFRDGENLPFQVFSIFRDITEQQNALADREEMMHIITHDLRSPISASLVLSDIIRDTIKDSCPGVSEEMDFLQKSLKRALQLTEAYVDSVKMDKTDSNETLKPVTASKIADDIAAIQKPLVQNAGLDWAMDMQVSEHVEMRVDEFRVKQVFENLIGNAIKFTPAPGRIRMIVSHNEQNVIFKLTDTGHGIDPKSVNKIFKKFFQPDHDRKGAGLGLYIVKKIVDAHDGTIDVQSRPQEGTTFTISIPRAYEKQTA